MRGVQQEAVHRSTPNPHRNDPTSAKTGPCFGDGSKRRYLRRLPLRPHSEDSSSEQSGLRPAPSPPRGPPLPRSDRPGRAAAQAAPSCGPHPDSLPLAQPARPSPPPPLAQASVVALTAPPTSSSSSPGLGSSAAAMIPLLPAAPERLATPTAAAILSTGSPLPFPPGLAAAQALTHSCQEARWPLQCPRGGGCGPSPCSFLERRSRVPGRLGRACDRGIA